MEDYIGNDWQFDPIMMLCDSDSMRCFEFNFDDIFSIEDSVYALMTKAGFDFSMSGTELLMEIITDIVIDGNILSNKAEFYASVAKTREMQIDSVKRAIERSLEMLTTKSFDKINELLGAEIFKGACIRANIFLSSICINLLLKKRHINKMRLWK